MKYTGTLAIPALGFAVAVEVDLEPTAAPAPAFLTDADLKSRWRCSPRTLYRIRTARRLAFVTPSPGRFLYAVTDVEEFEAAQRTAARPLVRVARRTA